MKDSVKQAYEDRLALENTMIRSHSDDPKVAALIKEAAADYQNYARLEAGEADLMARYAELDERVETNRRTLELRERELAQREASEAAERELRERELAQREASEAAERELRVRELNERIAQREAEISSRKREGILSTVQSVLTFTVSIGTLVASLAAVLIPEEGLNRRFNKAVEREDEQPVFGHSRKTQISEALRSKDRKPFIPFLRK